MSKLIKIALGFVVSGAVLLAVGLAFGGRGISISNNMKVVTEDDYELYSYKNMDLKEFESINIDMTNVPIYILSSDNGKYGVDVQVYIEDEEKIRIDVDDKELIVKDSHEFYWFAFELPSINIEKKEKEYVKVYLPEKEYDEFDIDTSNGKIILEDIGSYINELNLNASNAGVEVIKCNADKLVVDTSNGKVIVSDAKIEEIIVNTSNSGIEFENIEAENVNADTSNGAVKVMDSALEILEVDTSNSSVTVENIKMLSDKGSINIVTSNGIITAVLPDYSEKDFKITADTSNADIYLNGENLKESIYNTKEGKRKLNLNTSNGKIEIEFK